MNAAVDEMELIDARLRKWDREHPGERFIVRLQSGPSGWSWHVSEPGGEWFAASLGGGIRDALADVGETIEHHLAEAESGPTEA